MRRFVAVAIVVIALALVILIGMRALLFNGVHELGPAVSFQPQAPAITQQAPQVESLSPSPEGVEQP
ncbi:hypothetical protein [Varibaculum massiliense]|uniref:hypothetical protein n=1 Tax=Varibaculum massiliense TaxID=1852372 RepID=UPI0008DAF08F|nr:hypothetical protein [Varibaculum massiliense]